MSKRWKYMGDVNLMYGGTYYDFFEWKNGYVPAVEVTDLDSACGFAGAVLVERKVILVDRSDAQIAQALACVGAKKLPNGDIDDNGRVIKRRTAAWRWCVAYACQSYGFSDPDDQSETLQLERDGPMESRDGWKADKRLRANASLENYVRRHFLRG